MKTAVYFGSHHVYDDMIPASKSLLKNSDVDKIYFLIEDDVYPHEIPSCIETINIRDVIPSIYNPNNPNFGAEWTYVGLARTALTKIFPDLDTILTIDCDTIVVQDVSDLWDFDITDYYFAAAKEPHLSRASRCLYVNAGVMLLNLKKMREDKVDDEYIRALNEKRYYFVCQDVMNALSQGHILEIPSDYNSCDFTLPTDNRKIIHYAGNRRWRDYDIVKYYREMPWSETGNRF